MNLTIPFKWKMINTNPASLTSPPKIEYKEKGTWTIEEAYRFLKHTAEEPLLHIGYLLAIYTGMRLGEILGLRWKDCDFEKGQISIRQTLARTSKGLVFQEPKTKSSRRVIAITDDIVAALKKHKALQNQNKLLLGAGYQDHDLVVCTSKGTPIIPSNFRRHYKRMIREADVPKIRFHDLRHTHATIMLQLGEHPKVVSERLGHSRTSVTLDVYSHVIPNIQGGAAKKFSEAFQATK
ncbi:site-specific integrase [Laceyella sacchari]|uniref:Phage integrase family protein n=1 Tax=Laceyella tengchongensis TaxID=574699 RepID=A0AA45WPS5_9BACL|nr:site-specific integrase [Laceyella tengchongensis]AUS09971.1 site-specific integrase [Laceyella sacchari]SMP22431.1 Phage integrase family protein [Laceyella tengchongensis]